MSPSKPLEASADGIIELVYRAASGVAVWEDPLRRIAEASAATGVGLTAFDKRTGGVIAHYSAGPRPAEAPVEYARHFHRIDPRLALVRPLAHGKWFACQDHFDDRFVANDPFFQTFLLRYGARYTYAGKLLDTDSTMVVMSHHRPAGHPLVDPAERASLERIGAHCAGALRIERESGDAAERSAAGCAMLERLRQPAILLDRERRIAFRSDAAQAFLERADPLRERDGVLVCREPEDDAALARAMHDLSGASAAGGYPGLALEGRRTLRLRCADRMRIVVVSLTALRRPERAAFVTAIPFALLAVHQPGSLAEVDPQLLCAIFNFTGAEARMAVRLAAGRTVEDIATEFRLSVATVRTQLHSVFEKTGAKRQADLVRLLLGTSSL